MYSYTEIWSVNHIWKSSIHVLFFFLDSTGVWTQGFSHARQMLYHLVTSLALMYFGVLEFPIAVCTLKFLKIGVFFFSKFSYFRHDLSKKQTRVLYTSSYNLLMTAHCLECSPNLKQCKHGPSWTDRHFLIIPYMHDIVRLVTVSELTMCGLWSICLSIYAIQFI